MRKPEDNPMWRGDAASPQSKRSRARRLYSIDGVTCEREGCDEPAKHRHHINEDTGDNRRENLEFLCVRCHRHTHEPPLPPRPCANCGAMIRIVREGLCAACYAYRKRTGRERPWKTDGRKEGASKYYPRPIPPPKPCIVCGELAKPSRRGMCRRCYDRVRYDKVRVGPA